MRDVYKVDLEEIKKVKWQGDTNQYDLDLHALGKGRSEFIILNPTVSNPNLYHCIHEIPDTDRCVFWYHEGEWVAKYFKKNWTPKTGYKEIEIIKPEFAWRKNPDLDRTMTFEDDPFGIFEPEPWDMYYELVWYMDPRFNPLYDKVWAISCKPIGVPTIGVKDMGYVTPQVDIEFNEHIPSLDINIDDCYPAYYDLLNECAWELDPVHLTENDERLWVVKFTPRYRKPKEWQWYGVISPEFIIEHNPVLGELNYDLDLFIPWYNLGYEHVWMLDNKHLDKGEEEIWAFKIRVTDNLVGSTVIDYISPVLEVEYNEDLPSVDYNIDYNIPWYDLSYEHTWYLTEETKEKVWAVKLCAVEEPTGEKDMGSVSLIIPRLDVIFISYNEPNAEANWQRVLEKAPWAKRVNGIEGIFNAHKAAAKLSKTDMFYVVDGDAYLADDWQFDFEPSIFDRDCAYVWSSRNPINDLVYENGGVKLFPRSKLLKTRKWITLDMFTGTVKKTKSQSQVSNLTAFNTDEFSAWRSAFRECVKLYTINQMTKLNAWLTLGEDRQFGKYALEGASAGYQYAKDNITDQTALVKINDYNWLQNQFNLYYNKQ